MKHLSLLIPSLFLLIVGSASAKGRAVCEPKTNTRTTHHTLFIDFSETQLSIASSPFPNETTQWNIKESGLYSYIAVKNEAPVGNERFLDFVRLDINNNGSKIEGIPHHGSLSMQIVFGWMSLELDASGVTSDETYDCIRL